MELPVSTLLVSGLLATAIVQPDDRGSVIPEVAKKRKVRPKTDGGPVVVHVGIHVESLGNFRTTDMSFEVDAFLRLSWKDARLKWSPNDTMNDEERQSILVNDYSSLENIWLPDMYFSNARKASFQDVTVPNFSLLIFRDGTVAYSIRVTMTVACSLDLRSYPLDTQSCDINFASYAHTAEEMSLLWFSKDAVGKNDDIELPEFSVKEISSHNCIGTYNYAKTEEHHNYIKNFSCLRATIGLDRSLGYHMVQTYIPTGLIVCISWVSFWIDRTAVPARVSLSFTTLLTLSTMGAGLRYSLPPVSYAKAIDYWFGMSMIFIFGALLEFAIVNSLMRRSMKLDKFYNGIGRGHMKDALKKTALSTFGSDTGCPNMVDNFSVQKKQFEYQENIESGEEELDVEYINSTADDCKAKSIYYANLALNIDKACRLIFPIAFLVFNLCYWMYYSF